MSNAATFTITASSLVSWATPSPINYGTPLGSSQLNATSIVPGTLTYSPSAGSVPPLGNNTLTAIFMPTDAVTYSPVTLAVLPRVRVTITPSAPGIRGGILSSLRLQYQILSTSGSGGGSLLPLILGRFIGPGQSDTPRDGVVYLPAMSIFRDTEF